MRLLICSILIFTAVHSWAAETSKKKGKGVAFDAALGYPTFQITNPDDTNAFYTGIALQGRGMIPIIEGENAGIKMFGQLRYFDLQNTNNGGSQKEVANHIGGGGGLEVDLFKFFLGGDYSYMVARHYAVGTFSNDISYKYSTMNAYAGLKVGFGELSIAGSYGLGQGTILKSETGLSNDSKVNYSVIWVHVIYGTGSSLGDYLSRLFN